MLFHSEHIFLIYSSFSLASSHKNRVLLPEYDANVTTSYRADTANLSIPDIAALLAGPPVGQSPDLRVSYAKLYFLIRGHDFPTAFLSFSTIVPEFSTAFYYS